MCVCECNQQEIKFRISFREKEVNALTNENVSIVFTPMKGKTVLRQKNRHDHSKNSFANIKSYISPILKLNYRFKAVTVLKFYV